MKPRDAVRTGAPVGVLALGAVTVGLGAWRLCHHQSDILRNVWATVLLLVTGISFVGLIAVSGISRRQFAAIAATTVPASFAVYLWTVNITGADRCPWHGLG